MSGAGRSLAPYHQVLAQVYKYDQLNRLKQAQGVEGLTAAANSWEGVTDAVADRYKSAYTYDANGNILTAERHDETGQQYDDFAYQYHDPGGLLAQNRLYDLYDAATHTTGADIVAPAGTFDNSTTGVNQNNNYKYDELGNLIADTREEIGSIHWTVAGKVKRIARTPGSTKPELVFAYGAGGQRIMKQVGEPANGGFREYYIRDAQGNIMATYKYTNSGSAGASLMMTERPIYGSSRIGSHTQEMEMVGSTPPQYYPYTQPMPAPKKRYELTDHLGNVSTVVTGKLLPMAGGGYQAEVVSAQSYEPFGSLLPGRNYSCDSYRFGFNGQEKVDEVYGSTGNSYDFGARLCDPRVGRWLSVDPLARQYPKWSPYNFVMNSPIQLIDPNGMSVDNYTIDPAGKVALSEKANDNFDRLTAIDEFGDEVSKSMTINDQTLLPQLAASPRNAEIPGGSEAMNIGFTTDKVAATDLFKFASDNTNVEWGLMGFRTDEIERFAIGTSHAESHVASMDQFFNLYDKTFDIHSHPGPPGEASQDIHFGFGGWGDVPRAQQQATAFQKKGLPLPALGVYHVPSQGLYSYTHAKRNVFEGYIRTGKDLRNRLP